jgi:hypothetical protein
VGDDLLKGVCAVFFAHITGEYKEREKIFRPNATFHYGGRK